MYSGKSRLQIEEYFQTLQSVISGLPIVQSSRILFDRRAISEGYLRGEVFLIDGCVLHVREYVDVGYGLERLTYAYHFLLPDGTFCFRYDNADHHRRLGMPSHPHHKRDGDETTIIASPAPDLAAVLTEIERLIALLP